MTDKEIKKALECCKRDFSMRNCLDCPYNKEKSANCMSFMIEDALDLINRQQAGIEELKAKRLEDDKLLNDRVQDSVNSVSNANDKYVKALERVFNDKVAELRTANKVIDRIEAENISLRAEIERLENEVIAKENEYNDMLDQRNSVEYNLELLKQEKSVVRAEAIKEFAERLKDELSNLPRIHLDNYDYYVLGFDFIDNLVKEMVGEDK